MAPELGRARSLALRIRVLGIACAAVLVLGVASVASLDEPVGSDVRSTGGRDDDEEGSPRTSALPGEGTDTTQPGATTSLPPTAAAEGGAGEAGSGRDPNPEPDRSTGPPGPGPGEGPAGPLAPVRIAMVGTFCCPGFFVGEQVEPGRAVVDAWVASINASGGLAGHPVELIARDDPGGSDGGEALYRQLVEQERVVAFVADLALRVRLPIDYLESVGVPVIAPALTVEGYTSPVVFPVGTGPAGLAEGLARVAAANAWDDVAVVRCYMAHCSDVGSAFHDAAAAAGIRIVFDRQLSFVEPDLPCAGDAVILVGDAAAVRRYASTCSQPIVTASLGLDDQAPEDGTWAVTSVLPHVVDGTAGAQSYRALVGSMPATYPSIVGGQRPMIEGFATSAAFASVLLLERAAAVGTWGADVTSADIRASLASLSGDTLGGLVPALGFRPGQAPQDPACAYTVTATGGRWAAPGGATPTC